MIGTPLGEVRHHYSHFTLEGKVVLTDERPEEAIELYPLDAIEALPLSMADKKALELLKHRLL